MRILTYILSCVLFCSCSRTNAQKIFVSVTDGNDKWTGVLAKPNANKTEGPVATIERAITLVKQKSSSVKSDTMFIYLSSGRHFLKQTLKITPADWSSDKYLIVTSIPGTTAAISGATEFISAPQKRTLKGQILQIPVPGAISKTPFEQLYLDSKSLQRAREPNEGFGYMDNVKEDTIVKDKQKERPPVLSTYSISSTNLGNVYPSIDKQSAIDLQKIIITIPFKWNVVKRHISNFDKQNKRITTQKAHGMGNFVNWGDGMQFYLENAYSFIDVPGEWFYDDIKNLLYYYPQPAEKNKILQFLAPVNEELIKIEGESNDKRIKNIIFRDLIFEHTALHVPKEGFVAQQTSPYINAAVTINYGENINFSGCEFTNIANNAIWYKTSCLNSNIVNCYFRKIGAGAVKIGDYKKPVNASLVTRKITVEGNVIVEGGQIVYSAPGIAIYLSEGNKIVNNTIEDYKYSGISNGYTWGDTETPNGNNYIAFNNISRLGWGVMDDLGGIYTVGNSPGTKIVNNHIHDVYCYRYGAYGIYLDEGSSGLLIQNNLVYNCSSASFMCSHAKESKIINNIFASGQKAQIHFNYATREKAPNLVIEKNIIYWETGSLFNLSAYMPPIALAKNCFWNPTLNANNILNAGPKEMLANSMIKNPNFKDPANHNYDFKSNTLTRSLGFTPFKTGTKKTSWKNRTLTSSKSLTDAFHRSISQSENILKAKKIKTQ